MDDDKRPALRPNLLIMVVGMCVVAALQTAFGNASTLPLATGLGGSLGTLGLALLKDEPSAPAPMVTMPAADLKAIADGPVEAFSLGYRQGYQDGRMNRPDAGAE